MAYYGQCTIGCTCNLPPASHVPGSQSQTSVFSYKRTKLFASLSLICERRGLHSESESERPQWSNSSQQFQAFFSTLTGRSRRGTAADFSRNTLSAAHRAKNISEDTSETYCDGKAPHGSVLATALARPAQTRGQTPDARGGSERVG